MKKITTVIRFHHYLMKIDVSSSTCALEHEEAPPRVVSLKKMNFTHYTIHSTSIQSLLKKKVALTGEEITKGQV